MNRAKAGKESPMSSGTIDGAPFAGIEAAQAFLRKTGWLSFGYPPIGIRFPTLCFQCAIWE